MSPSRIWILGSCLVLIVACDKAPEPAKAEPAKVEPAKVEPAKVEAAKVEPAKAEPAKPEPVLVPAVPLSFTLGTRTFTGATALASRYNDQRRVIISSKPSTCEKLLAIPEVFEPGNVDFIVTTPWTVGVHPLASAEFIEDDTHAATNIYPKAATLEILAAPQNVGESGKIKLSVTAPEGSATGEIDVLLCE